MYKHQYYTAFLKSYQNSNQLSGTEVKSATVHDFRCAFKKTETRGVERNYCCQLYTTRGIHSGKLEAVEWKGCIVHKCTHSRHPAAHHGWIDATITKQRASAEKTCRRTRTLEGPRLRNMGSFAGNHRGCPTIT